MLPKLSALIPFPNHNPAPRCMGNPIHPTSLHLYLTIIHPQ